MMMLVIGALVIGYLIYFVSSSYRTITQRRMSDQQQSRAPQIFLMDEAAWSEADRQIHRLEQRIIVLERLIEPPAQKAVGE